MWSTACRTYSRAITPAAQQPAQQRRQQHSGRHAPFLLVYTVAVAAWCTFIPGFVMHLTLFVGYPTSVPQCVCDNLWPTYCEVWTSSLRGVQGCNCLCNVLEAVSFCVQGVLPGSRICCPPPHQSLFTLFVTRDCVLVATQPFKHCSGVLLAVSVCCGIVSTPAMLSGTACLGVLHRVYT
jgi:hypothetical protein